ncbi:MAG: hypothetical protein Q9166_007421 [cf. Caloplaca sp. 2 TL-2023]
MLWIHHSNANTILSAYYANADYAIPTDGVYKTATYSTMTATTRSSATATDATTSATSPTATPSPTPTPDPGLSTGAKAGIGIGVALGIIIIGAAAAFLWMRRRKTLKIEREKPAVSSYLQYSGVPQGEPKSQQPTTYYRSSELPSEDARTELDSQPYGAGNKPSHHEMQG